MALLFIALCASTCRCSRSTWIRSKASQIDIVKLILQRIDEVVDKFGIIKDNASPDLIDIRRNINLVRVQKSNLSMVSGAVLGGAIIALLNTYVKKHTMKSIKMAFTIHIRISCCVMVIAFKNRDNLKEK